MALSLNVTAARNIIDFVHEIRRTQKQNKLSGAPPN